MTLWFLVAMIGGLAPREELPRIVPSADRSRFVIEGTDRTMVLWGFNYDHDDAGRLLEDYWQEEWPTVVEDFREMKAMGANVVRIHLQIGRFMKSADQPQAENIDRLKNLLALAEETGLYLDLTGLACYHKTEVPAWYDALGEADRWAVQARFWKAIANACKGRSVVFCYDLMNEPILTGGDDKSDWLPGKGLGGKHFVQRITLDAKGRDDRTIAAAWVKTLADAIREIDKQTMITVGVIPWAQTFPGAKPLFYAPEVCAPLDFVSIHLYPRKGKLDDDLTAMKVYEIGKPLVVEEIFPLSAGFEETETFMQRSMPPVDGWISFYWGKTIEESKKAGDLRNAIVAGWLERFQKMAAKGDAPR